MKVLLLSMTVGQGHNSTSKAPRGAFEKRDINAIFSIRINFE